MKQINMKPDLNLERKNVSAYMTAIRKKIIDELFKNHKNNGYSNIKIKPEYWTETKLQDEVDKYKTRNEFIKNNQSAYNAAIKKGILNKLFKNHPNEGYSTERVKNYYWTKERLQEEEANKYETINEFSMKNRRAWDSDIRKGLLEILFKNHPNQGNLENRIEI